MVRETEGINRRTFLTATGAGATVALAGCLGNGDDTDTEPANNTEEDEPTPGNGQDDDNENGNENNQDGEDEFDPEYINDESDIQLEDYNRDLDEEPLDLFDGELTQEELTIEYLLDNVTGVRETEEQKQYNTDLEIVTELLETDHTTENQETQVRETNRNTTQNQYTEEELENGITEETTINLPEEIRNYTLTTTITDHQNNTTIEETTTLDFADAYTKARQHLGFENSPALGPDAELREIKIDDDKIVIEYETDTEIGTGDFNSTIAEITGLYRGSTDVTKTPYGLQIEAEDSNGDLHSEEVDETYAEEFLEGKTSSRDFGRNVRSVLRSELDD